MEVRNVTVISLTIRSSMILRMASFTSKKSVTTGVYLCLGNLTLIKRAWGCLWPRCKFLWGIIASIIFPSIAPIAPVFQEIQSTYPPAAVGQALKTGNSERQGRGKPAYFIIDKLFEMVWSWNASPIHSCTRSQTSFLQQYIFHSQKGDFSFWDSYPSQQPATLFFPTGFPASFCQTPVTAFPHLIDLFLIYGSPQLLDDDEH